MIESAFEGLFAINSSAKLLQSQNQTQSEITLLLKLTPYHIKAPCEQTHLAHNLMESENSQINIPVI